MGFAGYATLWGAIVVDLGSMLIVTMNSSMLSRRKKFPGHGHGHNHAGHGHSHGGHGHSHGGKPCGGHGHSHGGKPCVGHDHIHGGSLAEAMTIGRVAEHTNMVPHHAS